MRRAVAIAALAVVALAGRAFADEPRLAPLKPPFSPSTQSLDEVVRASPDCRSFTNGCEICLKDAGDVKCSTPGLACQPREWRCAEHGAKPQGI